MSFDSGQLLILEDGVLTDRTGLIHDDSSFTFDNTRGRRGTASVPLMLYADDVYLPKIGWPVWIYEVYQGSPVTTQAVFVGVIADFEWDYFNDAGDRIVTLTVVTLEKYFDSVQTPQQDFTSTTAGAIFTAIFNAVITLLPSAPVITLGTVDAGVSISQRSYTGTSNSAQDFQQLATDSAYIWYIDPRDLKVYFHAHDSRPASFTVVSEDIYIEAGKSSIKWTVSDVDFVSRQLIQQVQGAGTAAAPSNQTLFLGDGTTTSFTLPQIVSAVQAAFLSTGEAATSTGTFSGQPSDGDTITIVPAIGPTLVYTFKTALDNTVAKQILIGATVADTVQNLADGFNAFPGATGYSAPTTRNGAIAATVTSATTILVGSLPLGPSTTTITTTSGALSWSDSPLAGGTQSGTVQISCGVDGTGQFQLVYTPGSAVVTLLTAPPLGVHLTVMFQDPTPGLLATSNDQASTLGIAGQFRQIASNATVDQETAIQQAAARLAAYSVLPKVFSFQSDTPGLFCGGYVMVALTVPPQAAAVLNGNWLVQGVHGDWIAGFELNSPPFACHFRYTYTLINTTEVSTYQDTLLAILDTGPFVIPSAAQSVPNATTATTDHSGGTGGSGGDTMTPAQAWVQEQLGFSVLQAGNDLVMASSSTVSSASYSFTAGDVGRSITVVTAAGWTPGSYEITSVTAGIATITGAPAISGTTGGLWGTTDAHVYQFTWAPGVSFWTKNPIAVVVKLVSNGDSPLTFKALQLTPFAYAEVGYSITPISANGPDYTIAGDQLTLRVALADGDFLITEYFPDKPTKLPHKKAGDAPASGAQFVIAGDDGTLGGNIIQTSPDGAAWTQRTTPLASAGSAVAFGNGKYVCGCNQFFATTQQIATSPDAIHWTARSSHADSGGVQKIRFGGGVFVAIYGTFGSRSLMFSTDNGATWSTSTIPSSLEWVDIAWSPDLSLFLAVADDGSTMHSAHGDTWTAGGTLSFGAICVGWGDSKFVVLGGSDGSPSDHLATSTDGTSFTTQSDPAGNPWGFYAVTFGGGKFVAVRGPVVGSGIIASGNSTDGDTWSENDMGVNAQWSGVAFGAGVYVAVDSGASGIISTPDAAAWTPQTAAGGSNFRAICYG